MYLDLNELILSDNKLLATIDELAFSKNVTGEMHLDYPPLKKVNWSKYLKGNIAIFSINGLYFYNSSI